MELERIITMIQMVLLFVCIFSKSLIVQAYAGAMYMIFFAVLVVLVCN